MTPKYSIPGPAYRITTPRMTIRCPEPSDAPVLDLAIKLSLDHLLPWMLWAKEEPVSLDERLEFLRRTRGNFDLSADFGYLVFNLSETLFLGGTGLSPRLGKDTREISYWIHKCHTHQGFATEVAAALTRVAFEVDHVRRVEIHCSNKNIYSATIPKKLGYFHEATLHEHAEDVNGGLHDLMLWSLLEENYLLSPLATAKIQAFDVIGRRIL
jgi:RimJ/RimL family protein N-acetyltransferase